MKKNIKKIISAVVVSSMLLSLAGCADKANEQVLDAVDGFASAVKGLNAKKIAKACSEDLEGDDLESIEHYCDINSWDTADNLALINVVSNSLEYEVDEDSVEASTKKGEGSVDVTFTMLDWESVIDDESVMTDVDTATAAMEAADTTEVTVTVEFELDDEEWVVTNGYDVFFEVCSYLDKIDVEFAAPLEISSLQWWGTDDGNVDAYTTNGVYTNVNQIDLYMPLVDYSADYSNVYYVVESNGQILYTSSTGEYDGYYNAGHGATFDENGYIPAGTYTITFYNGDEEMATGTCTVIVDVEPVSTGSGETEIDAEELNAALASLSVGEISYLESTSDFYANTSACHWYDVAANTTNDTGVYAAGTSTIQITCQANQDCGSIGCIYMYSEDGNYENAELVTYDFVDVTSYSNGDFYDFNCEGVVSGTYWVILCDSTGNVPYVISCCQVG